MLAFASAEPVDGASYLARLAELSLRGNLVDGWERRPGGNHPDGWGVAYRDRGEIHVVRSGLPAGDDPLLRKTRIRARRLLAHVRYASDLATVNAGNTHPFLLSGTALAHNGTFRGTIGAEASKRGVSDTLVFLERLAGVWRERTLETLRDALSAILGDPALVGDYSAANLLIATEDSIFALRKFRRNGDYYSLHLRRRPGLAEVASQPLDDGPGWESMENGLLVELDPRGPRSVHIAEG